MRFPAQVFIWPPANSSNQTEVESLQASPHQVYTVYWTESGE
ncbi:hypothetical protein [Mycobacteroides abscessus]|nr:hypothetical protein [Mycobacteroides abscessus]